jgi:hypothetical protein
VAAIARIKKNDLLIYSITVDYRPEH